MSGQVGWAARQAGAGCPRVVQNAMLNEMVGCPRIMHGVVTGLCAELSTGKLKEGATEDTENTEGGTEKMLG